jgi:hypothetical protein
MVSFRQQNPLVLFEVALLSNINATGKVQAACKGEYSIFH